MDDRRVSRFAMWRSLCHGTWPEGLMRDMREVARGKAHKSTLTPFIFPEGRDIAMPNDDCVQAPQKAGQ
jgi:hypothetical protein